MAEPILKLTRGVPKTDREWMDVFRNLTKFFRVSGEELVIGGDIALPDQSVGTAEIVDLAVTTAKLAGDAVTNDKLRDSSALSVMGRAANTGGNPGDIVSTVADTFMVRRGSALTWDALSDGDIPASIARDAEVSAAISAHEAAANPHPVYLTQAEGDVLYAAVQSDTYTATLTGCTTSPTGTVRLVRSGNIILAYVPVITGTSNATTATLTGTMPAGFLPARTQDVLGRAVDNGLNGICGYRINTSGTIEMFFGAALAGWTAAGTKGTNNSTLAWSID